MNRRERFEADYCKLFPIACRNSEKFDITCGEYSDTTVEIAWLMYQVALFRENKRCADHMAKQHTWVSNVAAARSIHALLEKDYD